MSEPGSMIRTLSGRLAARNYHSYVINEIGLGIVSGLYPVGSTLPGDAEMTDRFNVSRTVLREALKTIEAKGLVEARAKVGTRVLPRGRWNLFDRQVLLWICELPPDAGFLESFLELRAALEDQIAALAAARRSPEHLRMLQYWQNQRGITAALPEPHAMAEFEFHRILCEATQNPFLRAASGLVEFGIVKSMAARMAAQVADLAAEKNPLYADLVQAVTRQEAAAAQASMRLILAADRGWTLAAPPAD